MSRKNVNKAIRVSALVIRFLREELTPAERAELEAWLKEDGKNRNLLRRIFDEKLAREDIKLANRFDPDQAFNRLIANIRQSEHPSAGNIKTLKPYYKIASAAAIVLMVAGAAFFILTSKKETKSQQNLAVTKKENVKQEVMLTLAGGRKVSLEKQGQGVIATQGKSVVIRQNNGLLSYTASSSNPGNEVVDGFNQLEIPRGKQYRLLLPDGSRVWLNAQTVLRFPGNFNKNERVVELSGEAYFEVSHSSAWPFRVKTKEQTVEVLGTHFNVSAYPEDGKTITTLESGSVRVTDRDAWGVLKPGQFALKNNGQNGFEIATADLNEALGWKNGTLVFKDATIEELMQTVARTFDVDIDVDPKVKGRHFGGSYMISNGLPNLLRNLEQTDVVHIKVKGRRISVMP